MATYNAIRIMAKGNCVTIVCIVENFQEPRGIETHNAINRHRTSALSVAVCYSIASINFQALRTSLIMLASVNCEVDSYGGFDIFLLRFE